MTGGPGTGDQGCAARSDLGARPRRFVNDLLHAETHRLGGLPSDLVAAWDRLATELSQPYATPGWLSSWAAGCGEFDRAQIGVVSKNGAVQAVLPLIRPSGRGELGRVGPRVWRLLGAEVCGPVPPLVRPMDPVLGSAAVRLIADWLSPSQGLLMLRTRPPGGRADGFGAVRDGRCLFPATRPAESMYVVRSAPSAPWPGTLSGKARRQLGQVRRRFERVGDLEAATSQAALDEGLEAFLALHFDRWETDGGALDERQPREAFGWHRRSWGRNGSACTRGASRGESSRFRSSSARVQRLSTGTAAGIASSPTPGRGPRSSTGESNGRSPMVRRRSSWGPGHTSTNGGLAPKRSTSRPRCSRSKPPRGLPAIALLGCAATGQVLTRMRPHQRRKTLRRSTAMARKAAARIAPMSRRRATASAHRPPQQLARHGWGRERLGQSRHRVRPQALRRSRRDRSGDGPRRAELEQAGIPVDVANDDPVALEAALRGVDIAHVFRTGLTEPAVPAACRRAGVPHLIETNVFGRIDASSDERQFDCHLFVGKMCAWRYRERVGPAGPSFHDRHRVLHWPVDIPRLRRLAPARADAKAALGLDPERPVVGRIGRDDDSKWRRLLIDMLPRLLELAPETQVLIVGATPEKRRRLRRLGLTDRVVFADTTVDEVEVVQRFCACDVFVTAAEIGESYSVALSEAMALGLPIVTCSTPWVDDGQIEQVDNGSTGYVADRPSAFAEACAELVRDPARARAFGEAGAAKAERLMDRVMLTRQLESLYEGLARDGTAPREWIPAPSEVDGFGAEYARRRRDVSSGL